MKKRIAMLLMAAVLMVTVLVISCSKDEAEMGTGGKTTEKTTLIVGAGGDPMSWNPDPMTTGIRFSKIYSIGWSNWTHQKILYPIWPNRGIFHPTEKR